MTRNLIDLQTFVCDVCGLRSERTLGACPRCEFPRVCCQTVGDGWCGKRDTHMYPEGPKCKDHVIGSRYREG